MHRKDGRPLTEHVTDRRCARPGLALQCWAAASVVEPRPGPDRQAVAADAIAGHAPLVLVFGPAGTGKTRTTATAVATLRYGHLFPKLDETLTTRLDHMRQTAADHGRPDASPCPPVPPHT